MGPTAAHTAGVIVRNNWVRDLNLDQVASYLDNNISVNSFPQLGDPSNSPST